MEEKILEVQDLSTSFKTERGWLKAIDGVSFDVYSGEMLGIVGESGCGKSVTSQSILRLYEEKNTTKYSGTVSFDGQNLFDLPEKEMQKIRGQEISMVFQDALSSLNPVFTVGNQIMESLRIHQNMGKKEAKEKAIDLLDQVGIPDPQRRFYQYPFELSGGMNRRVLISTAVMEEPRLVIADEPTPGLDKKTAKRAMEHFRNLADMGAAVLVITHDLELALETVDRIAVFYGGTTIEEARAEDFQREENLRHPYTKALWRAMPRHGFQYIEGSQPYVKNLPKGCIFSPRCSQCQEACRGEIPYREVRGGKVRCLYAQ